MAGVNGGKSQWHAAKPLACVPSILPPSAPARPAPQATRRLPELNCLSRACSYEASSLTGSSAATTTALAKNAASMPSFCAPARPPKPRKSFHPPIDPSHTASDRPPSSTECSAAHSAVLYSIDRGQAPPRISKRFFVAAPHPSLKLTLKPIPHRQAASALPLSSRAAGTRGADHTAQR